MRVVREIYRHPAFRLPYLRRFSAMTLAPFAILYRDGPENVDPVLRRHEADWVRGLVRTGSADAAYRQIRWEVEAYAAQRDPGWPPECADLQRPPDAARPS